MHSFHKSHTFVSLKVLFALLDLEFQWRIGDSNTPYRKGVHQYIFHDQAIVGLYYDRKEFRNFLLAGRAIANFVDDFSFKDQPAIVWINNRREIMALRDSCYELNQPIS